MKKLRNISSLSEFTIAFSENVWYTVVDKKINAKKGIITNDENSFSGRFDNGLRKKYQ